MLKEEECPKTSIICCAPPHVDRVNNNSRTRARFCAHGQKLCHREAVALIVLLAGTLIDEARVVFEEDDFVLPLPNRGLSSSGSHVRSRSSARFYARQRNHCQHDSLYSTDSILIT
jgi:hypothetical protein